MTRKRPRATRPSAVPEAPCVAVLASYIVRYKGRATAEGRGDLAVVLAKLDGCLLVHDPVRHVQPLFYNPAGTVQVWRRMNRWYFRARSTGGEVLSVSGIPVERLPPRLEGTQRVRRIRATEREFAEWLAGKPEGITLPPGRPDQETLSGGGRVDLLFPDGTVVEVKKRATIRSFDQAQRYLRAGAPRVVIACMHASPSVRLTTKKSRRIDLLIVDPSLPPGDRQQPPTQA